MPGSSAGDHGHGGEVDCVLDWGDLGGALVGDDQMVESAEKAN